MSRPSTGAYYGDDLSALPLHNDSHVGINMSAMNPGAGAQAGQSGPYPPSPNSTRTAHSSSHGHGSSSSHYQQQASSGNVPQSSSGQRNYAYDNMATSPRLVNAHGQPLPYQQNSNDHNYPRYALDPSQHGSSSNHRSDTLSRSLSMGHGGQQNQSRSSSNVAAATSAMFLSPQTHAAQTHGSSSYLSPTSPPGTRHSSFITHGTSSNSPQTSYGGLPSLSASGHPSSFLSGSQIMSNPYNNPSNRRSPNAMDLSSVAYQPSKSPTTMQEAMMANTYSPNSGQAHRYGTNVAGGLPQARSGSNDLGPSSLMDLNMSNDSRSPNQLGLKQNTSGQTLSRQYDTQSGLGDLGDTLPYAYQSSHAQQASASGSGGHYMDTGNRNSHFLPSRNMGNDFGGPWASPTGSNRNSMIFDSSRANEKSGHSTARNSPLYSDGTSFGQQGLGIGSSGSMTTASDNSRTSSSKRDSTAHRSSRRLDGFRRVRDFDDLRPVIDKTTAAASGAAAISDGKAATAAAITTARRADPSGGFVSPLKALTAYLHHTYHLVNPAFFYELSFNPRRVLTKPSKPVQNEGRDNEESDYILYVNDWLGTEEGHKYLILDVLGQGTFGQVVKCQDMTTHEIVAVKVIKNKPAYFNQSMMEVTVLEMLNGNWDPNDEHHILRLKDTFIHAKHLCLVLELLSSNLYELIKQNSFQGLSTSLVRVFTAQLLDALTILNEARLIHCDLKPENILLKTLQTPSIKLVDFGSACHEKQTVYTYIQSRFYRSPEVLLGLPYNSAIDLWSLGCIAVELFLGLPLFPGTSEYNQICRIVEMLGLPPQWMLDNGKQTQEFFSVYQDEFGRKSYRLKSIDQYSKEHNVQEQPSKKYFKATTLPDIVKTYPMSRKSGKSADLQKEMANRSSFIDFVTGLLNMNPHERWTPQQAKLHPFITGEKFTKPFRPPPTSVGAVSQTRSKSSDSSKHPYGGLLPQNNASRPSNKAFQDAASYNQHLAQQQAYNSAASRQQSQQVMNNPYAREDAASAQAAEAKAVAKAQAAQMAQAQAHAQAQQQYEARQSMQPPASSSYYQGGSGGAGAVTSNSSRQNRADNRLSMIPPQLAKLGLEQTLGGGLGMSSMVNRDDPLREWERRQNGLAPSSTASGSSSSKRRQNANYQQLDLLQQQAELGAGWNGQNWDSTGPGASSNNPGSGGGGGGFSVVVDGSQDRNSGGRSNVAAPLPAAGSSGHERYPSNQSSNLSTALNNYNLSSGMNGTTAISPSGSHQQQSTLPFDIYDSGMANLMAPALTPVRIQDRDQHAHHQHSLQQQQQQQYGQGLPQHYGQLQAPQQQQQHQLQQGVRDKRKDASGSSTSSGNSGSGHGSMGMLGGFN